MFKTLLASTVLSLVAFPALADFQRWSYETEKDPFSGGERVTVTHMTSVRSGVLLMCDTSDPGLIVRVIPGYVTNGAAGKMGTIKFAVDGELLLENFAVMGEVGDSLATSETILSFDKSTQLVDAMAAARKQIAIDDGFSDRPHLLNARGSTKSGEALKRCMLKQETVENSG